MLPWRTPSMKSRSGAGPSSRDYTTTPSSPQLDPQRTDMVGRGVSASLESRRAFFATRQSGFNTRPRILGRPPTRLMTSASPSNHHHVGLFCTRQLARRRVALRATNRPTRGTPAASLLHHQMPVRASANEHELILTPHTLFLQDTGGPAFRSRGPGCDARVCLCCTPPLAVESRRPALPTPPPAGRGGHGQQGDGVITTGEEFEILDIPSCQPARYSDQGIRLPTATRCACVLYTYRPSAQDGPRNAWFVPWPWSLSHTHLFLVQTGGHRIIQHEQRLIIQL
ncbi:hypothetical protein F5X68DRAFT_7878 [Plectosphaerella plurivora]|uniref:Uncharacterized protein n=1 Tax=Plectosphaerella plurivora TaxID=936078 RepID=A0A9P8VDQ0_9PEZI|nr:hypothetical protein F5X68DRAFT_7878 [Plectosphaerella plurivora]